MKSIKDILVSEYLERAGGDVLASEHFRAIVRGMIKGHAGVYVAYGGELYVSLSAAAKAVVGRVPPTAGVSGTTRRRRAPSGCRWVSCASDF